MTRELYIGVMPGGDQREIVMNGDTIATFNLVDHDGHDDDGWSNANRFIAALCNGGGWNVQEAVDGGFWLGRTLSDPQVWSSVTVGRRE